jgi:signal transduction histidine kinase
MTYLRPDNHRGRPIAGPSFSEFTFQCDQVHSEWESYDWGKTSESSGVFQCWVQDSGAGIEQERLAKIFENSRQIINPKGVE